MQWLQKWCVKHGVSENDRLYHELRVLCASLKHFGCYDQVNLGALVGIEEIAQRIGCVVDAYRQCGRNEKPNWGNAKYFGSVDDVDDLLAPGLQHQVSKKGTEEVNLVNARKKITKLDGDDDDGDESKRKKKGGGKAADPK